MRDFCVPAQFVVLQFISPEPSMWDDNWTLIQWQHKSWQAVIWFHVDIIYGFSYLYLLATNVLKYTALHSFQNKVSLALAWMVWA